MPAVRRLSPRFEPVELAVHVGCAQRKAVAFDLIQQAIGLPRDGDERPANLCTIIQHLAKQWHRLVGCKSLRERSQFYPQVKGRVQCRAYA